MISNNTIERWILKNPLNTNKGQKIALLGGSFNPAHSGHVQISEIALKKLNLDYVLWLVSPKNPIKNYENLIPIEQRVEKARSIISNKKILVTDIESKINTKYTIDTLKYLTTRYAERKFVWLMGADNLTNFHLWKSWKEIAKIMPIVIIDRPESSLKALASLAANYLKQYRLDEEDSNYLIYKKAPAWIFIHDQLNGISSTKIRNKK
ncbi:nicotinate-nucleotide adenylyltransferase [Hyphomicrobiales bacterium]|jgi:nicotinate-nucleotide adenylyltransferase|nr:nicotinate-nucleotide adenylyltransferase [Hyphomicrobiales bacterium]MDC0139709.1 nicotinate-nucleotide adenylyltransferase [Hyphomicrobiales bacterium]MDC3272415.1 nicotinate-nucleotide adenylyltransferase [Hyphomicrobiales bacterium]|tara:strand:- start:5755 stop:6378 length:624 start_codon:yes stop_codon:yes gene_type:complete